MNTKSVRIAFILGLTFSLTALLVSCNPGSITPLKTTGISPINSSSPSEAVVTDSPSITVTSSPTIAPTPTHFISVLPTPAYTASPLPPLSDGSDLLTATPKTYYKDLPYIQIIQDNKAVEPVDGVIKLKYSPFVLRYIKEFVGDMNLNFSFNNAFQNNAHEGLDPFLPCPNPYCADNQLSMQQHIITIDDNKYNFMHYCRGDEQHEVTGWIWDRCTSYGIGEKGYNIYEHDIRKFGLILNGNFEIHPIPELKFYGDKIFITAYCVFIDRLSKEVARDSNDQKFDLIKIILQFEG